tara:strand:- start:572 stop:1141 length:570 start_codon:yes stop_codon:yes gene_type:complete
MATKLEDYIKCYDNMINDSLCNEIIEAYKQSGTTYVNREQRPTFHELNISKKFKAEDPLWNKPQKILTETFIDVVNLYMEDLEIARDFPVKYTFEEYRMKRYEANDYDQFKDHVDVQDYSSARRFVVIFLYLNDVLEGGESNFPRLDLAITPKQGRILVFPANWQYRHAGLPVKSNDKYIIGSYLHYLE